MSDPIQKQSQSIPDSASNDPRVDAKNPIIPEPRREDKEPTKGGQQQQQRLDEGKIDGPGREKREVRNTEPTETSHATSNAKEAARGTVENKASGNASDSSLETKRGEGSNASSAPFIQKTAGDKLPANSGVQETKGQSQGYRDRYAEVMRDFHAGTLRRHGNQVVKDADEAKALASEQASKFDASSEQKA